MRIQILKTDHIARSMAYEVRVYVVDECIMSMYGSSEDEVMKSAMDGVKELHKELDDFLTIGMISEASK